MTIYGEQTEKDNCGIALFPCGSTAFLSPVIVVSFCRWIVAVAVPVVIAVHAHQEKFHPFARRVAVAIFHVLTLSNRQPLMGKSQIKSQFAFSNHKSFSAKSNKK